MFFENYVWFLPVFLSKCACVGVWITCTYLQIAYDFHRVCRCCLGVATATTTTTTFPDAELWQKCQARSLATSTELQSTLAAATMAKVASIQQRWSKACFSIKFHFIRVVTVVALFSVVIIRRSPPISLLYRLACIVIAPRWVDSPGILVVIFVTFNL